MKVNAHRISFLLILTLLIGTCLPLVAFASAQRYSWCTLNVTINLPGAGTVTPSSGSYYYGDYIVARAYTNPGYSFDGWYLNGVYQGKLSSIPITMNQNHQLLAVFSKRVVSLTITANPPMGGTIAPGTGVWNYTSGDSVVIKEFTNPGYTFSGWYLDGAYMGAGPSITVIMDRDHQLGAFFAGGNNEPIPTPVPTPIPAPTPTPAPNLPTPELVFYCTSSTKNSGFYVRIEGMLTYQGIGLSGAGILFSYSVTGGFTWLDLAYVNTDDDGSYSAVWMPSASGNYVLKATWAGDSVYGRVSKTANFAVTPTEDPEQNVFSVASNSTLSSLAFDSDKNEFGFSVSGPSGTAGYVQVCVPKSLLSDASNLKVTLDGIETSYDALSKGDVWIITVIYAHSTHKVVMALNAQSSMLNMGSLGNDLLLGAVIVVLVAIIAVLVIINLRKRKS